MPVFHRPADLVRYQMERFAAMGSDIQQIHREMVRGVVEDHVTYTGGTLSAQDLARLGHPYARRAGGLGSRGAIRNASRYAGRGLSGWETKGGKWTRSTRTQIRRGGAMSGLPINQNTGRLRRSLFVAGPSGSNHEYRVGFRIPYAAFVLAPGGTSKMVARGFYSDGGKLGVIARNHKARQSAFVRVQRERLRRLGS